MKLPPMAILRHGFILLFVIGLMVVSRDGLAGQADGVQRLFREARSFRYVSDAHGDYWQSPEETSARRAGDCEDKALWLFYRLKSEGYKYVEMVVGKKRPSDRIWHAWVVCRGPGGETLILDPSAQKRIWNANRFSTGEYRPVYSVIV